MAAFLSVSGTSSDLPKTHKGGVHTDSPNLFSSINGSLPSVLAIFDCNFLGCGYTMGGQTTSSKTF